MTPETSTSTGQSRWPGFLKFLAPAPPAAVPLTDAAEIKARYRYWQNRILLSSIIGYALFYFVRKNLSMAMPAMTRDLDIDKVELGLFLTLHGLLYGVSKFFHGFVGDRANARTLMATGLLLSALFNVLFGFSSAVLALGIFWVFNGWVQGMGFPPCARLMTHWFPPRQLATKMAVWNTSHSIGALLVVVLCGYLVAPRGEMIPQNWRLCFWVPAAIAIAGGFFLLFALRDTPPSLGLPEVEGTAAATDQQKESAFSSFLFRQVFSNPVIWLIALANFFVYTVRYAVLDWGPTFLNESKGIKLSHAGWMVAAFEGAGVAGMLSSGWLTDRIFGGRGARTCVFYMILTTFFMWLFWKWPNQTTTSSTILLCCAGFGIYGPQALVGTIAANLATKRAAATAVGLTGIFGYASTLLSGVGLGALVKARGWDAGFAGMLGVALVGTLLFVIAWPARAHGYAEHNSSTK